MKILLNDIAYEFEGKSLQELLQQLEKDATGVAIALDQQVVPKSRWHNTELTENSQVCIFESIAGG